MYCEWYNCYFHSQFNDSMVYYAAAAYAGTTILCGTYAGGALVALNSTTLW